MESGPRGARGRVDMLARGAAGVRGSSGTRWQRDGGRSAGAWIAAGAVQLYFWRTNSARHDAMLARPCCY